MHQFTEIIGQDLITEHLAEAIRSGKVSHAYIFDGAEGSGKRFLADIFAAALLCEDPRTDEAGFPEPCGRCASCLQADAGSNPDILHPGHEKERSFGVDDIRAIRADVAVKPYAGRYKIYIIDEAEKMTPAAQNALLKTIEEPPGYAVLILLADGTENFLPTVLSRCITLHFKPVPDTQIVTFLTDRKLASPERAVLIAGFASGSPGRAAALAADENFTAEREHAEEFLAGLSRADAVSLAAEADALTAEDASPAVEMADYMETWFRDVLIAQATGETERLVFRDCADAVYGMAARMTPERIQDVFNALAEYRGRIRSNIRKRTALLSLFLAARSAVSGAGEHTEGTR